jgi:hypothetical protein
MDTRSHYRSFFWPVVLIGVGLLWLLGNLGIISSANLVSLLRLWPVLLIFIGLDLIFARRFPLIGGLLGLALVLLMAGMMIFSPQLALATDEELKTETFSEPLEGAAAADIDLDFWSIPMQVQALDGSTNLFEAEITHTGEVIFQAEGGEQRAIRLSHENLSLAPWDWFSSIGQQKGTIGLSPEVPIDLAVDIGSGSADLNLAELQLTLLEINGGSGSLDLYLPTQDESFPVRMDTGSGAIDILTSSGAQFDLDLNSGSGSIHIEISPAANATLELNSGSGSVNIDVPAGAAVRVEVRADGSGGLNVGGDLEQVRGDEDTGVWETPGFEDAQDQILIVFAGRGSGSVTVR